MSQNPQINTPTKNNQPFFNNGLDNHSNGLQQVNQLDQPSNIFYNENATCICKDFRDEISIKDCGEF